MRNHYATLGVLPTASGDEIRASYRQLVKRFHPDVPGGNAQFFARISEAYEVLSEPKSRKAYDETWRRPRMGQWKASPSPRRETAQRHAPRGTRPGEYGRSAGRSATGTAGRQSGRGGRSKAPLSMLTRVMSIAVPRTGRFQLEGLIGNIQIAPTTAKNLWDTTLHKFGAQDPAHLARHVIQIKLSGERDLVKTMMPRPTDFGVEFEGAREAEKQTRLRNFIENLLGNSPLNGFFNGKSFGLYGAFLPLTLQITVPKGTPLFLRDITGTISVADVEGEVGAKLLGGVLKATRVTKAHVILNGGSRAFIARAQGMVDLMGFGTSKSYLSGDLSRLRVVLENKAQAEVNAPLDLLMAEVNGSSLLRVKHPVREAVCEAKDRARVELYRVDGRLEHSQTHRAQVITALNAPQMTIAG